MNVVFVIASNTSGGAERVISILCNYFQEIGDRVSLINLDKDSCFYEINRKVNIIKLEKEYPSIAITHNKIYKQFLIIKILKKEFTRINPDIVIPFLFNSEFPVILATQMLHIPCITSVRNSPEVYPHYQRIFRRLFYPRISGVVLQSNKVLAYKDFAKVKNKTVIMNPLNTPIIFQRPTRKAFKVISVGRLNSQKNHALVISSVCELKEDFPEITLEIYGTGELDGELKELANSYGKDNCVVFKGAVTKAIEKNNDAQLFVMASNYEGFPNALVEAMSCHIPVICTDFDTGVAKELIENNKNGYLIPIGNKEKLKETISYAFTHIEETELKADCAINKCEGLNYKVIGEQWRNFIISSINSLAK